MLRLEHILHRTVQTLAVAIDTSFLLQLVLPFFGLALAARPVMAQTAPQVELAYNQTAAELTVTASPVERVEYQVEYTTHTGLTQGYSFTPTTSTHITDSTFRHTAQAGTQSGQDVTADTVTAGTLQLQAELISGESFTFNRSFTIHDGQVVWNSESASHTWENISVGQLYQAPMNQDVQVIFSELPESIDVWLDVREVTLSNEQVAELGALSNVGYEFTTNMENGSFRYDLTLPNPQPEVEATIQYSEDGETFHSVGENEQFANTVTIRGLDHFTVFVVVDGSSDTGFQPVFVANPDQEVFTIDNNTTGYSESGSGWVNSIPQSCANKAINNNGRISGVNNAKAIWSFQVPTDGTYLIDAHWVKNIAHTTKAQYRVFDDTNAELAFIQHNQEAGLFSGCVASGWQSITSTALSLEAGRTYRVELTAVNPVWSMFSTPTPSVFSSTRSLLRPT